MTTKQLIEILQTYPPDSEVVAQWDAGWSDMDEHSLEQDELNENCTVVQFDVSDYGSYERRKRYLRDQNENHT